MRGYFFCLAVLYMTLLQADPTIFAIAGSPASGKTSFIQKKNEERFFPQDVFIHDCDAVMVSLEGYQSDVELLGSVQAFQNWELPAREKAEALLMEAVKERRDILYDRSCALPSSYTFLKDLVDNHGYTLVMHVLYVTEKEACLRAEKREQETGRHIPKDVLLERMVGIKNLWPSYLELAKTCYLYDSHNPSLRLIAQGTDADLVIFDPELYASFLR
jgi:predicted ABC-type ATPase